MRNQQDTTYYNYNDSGNLIESWDVGYKYELNYQTNLITEIYYQSINHDNNWTTIAKHEYIIFSK
ncbi:MAG: hypothetical protein EPN82_07710 [Bacteroidetes bacterium]|nr:MAG: hypothetical protein EPN82_07710 [Bacteroidota bacterium]